MSEEAEKYYRAFYDTVCEMIDEILTSRGEWISRRAWLSNGAVMVQVSWAQPETLPTHYRLATVDGSIALEPIPRVLVQA